MTGSKRCIICLNYLKSKKKLLRQHSVDQQLVCIYFLRKLAWKRISNSEMEKFLKIGNPTEWAALCYICEEEVRRCLDMHREVMRMVEEITDVRKKLYEENYYDSEEEDDDETSSESEKEEEPSGNLANVNDAFKKLRHLLFAEFKESEQNICEFENSVSVEYKGANDPDPKRVVIKVKTEKVVEVEEDEEEDSYFTVEVSRDNDLLDSDSNEVDVVSNNEQQLPTSSSSNLTSRRQRRQNTTSTTAVIDYNQVFSNRKSTKCHYCGKKFTSTSCMRRHVKESHLKMRNFKCTTCLETFPRREYLVAHIQLKHPSEKVKRTRVCKDFKCSQCPSIFFARSSLRTHLRREHDIFEKYYCDKCPKWYASNRMLGLHKPVTHKVTGTQVSTKNTKMSKLKVSNAKRFSCQQCSKTFISKGGLGRHEREIHAKTRAFVCQTCGSSWIRKPDLLRHIFLQHEANFEEKVQSSCTICKKVLPSERTLLNHMRLVHNQKQELQCDICGKAYWKADSLAMHHLFYHKKKNPGIEKGYIDMNESAPQQVEEDKLQEKSHPDVEEEEPTANIVQLSNMKSDLPNVQVEDQVIPELDFYGDILQNIQK